MELYRSSLKRYFIDGTRVDVYLINGIKLTGLVENFDDDHLILEGNQLVNRLAVSTIKPHGARHEK